MKITTAQAKGPRPYQEDAFAVINDNSGGVLLAVFDGHGGSEASQTCVEYLKLINSFKVLNGPYKEFAEDSMRELFKEMNQATANMECGTTASLVYITPDKLKAIVGILGDSPVFIIDQDLDFVKFAEHNARSNEAELNAALARGARYYNGYIFDMEQTGGIYGGFFNAKGLQMTRALGDKALERVLLRTPDIYTINLGPFSHVVVASDGLVDPTHLPGETNEGMEWIKHDLYRGDEAELFLERAKQRGLNDNVTVISAYFKGE